MTTPLRAAPLLLLRVVLLAQTPQPEVSSTDAAATFRSRVNLVMVPVVVRDNQGHAVGGLTKEDFQLFDKGKPEVIAQFSVEQSADRPATPPPNETAEKSETVGRSSMSVPTRFVAYVFDDLHTEFRDLAIARDAAEEHIKDALRETDRAAIYTTSGQHMLDFTGDRAKIHEALFALRAQSRLDAKYDCPPMTYYEADQILNVKNQGALDTAVLDGVACSTVLFLPNDRKRLESLGACPRILQDRGNRANETGT